ncbi:MAG: enoyl-[acyl-carrier-protein] reductase [Burkholderiales bacterium 35-55-47]|jgi:enoyl-[acyl-carrier protein] reductase I|uniref:enoyl-ACP reductase FabI n=1 Tax=Limnohabitans sp. TaxID=1907725 RepID=UPI000BCE5A63|nr:enoyl-ACP reductase FabI [Limnohabitans sp.]OYY18945.1 MAG: enoyl-[acyl-carrier-protein] reductase [Burkholderiales bacterium 35-55-47]OYZ73763.1 MAG: enoyl-[acyl-carrier-protein] reductase [Burkholderiales bacterium 24-55-52]OZB00908.1 MAG: enoyl-[acyl-carrier-protein] reductase [Burkholderiales bacterium 39-55-53]HQR85303.1 enoyl-ACP reductase FabI [Limnohabitans sp.]HQS27289.1 enoyl-ACP reductase FabI [Limnohabitans sp.]
MSSINEFTSSPFSLDGKKGLVLGLANEHSIAWGCVHAAQKQGADIVATCLNNKARSYVEPLTEPLGVELVTCNVEETGAMQQLVTSAVEKLGHLDFVIHSIAWAPLEDLHANVTDTSSEGFARAMEVSCHSFATLAKLCTPHMPHGGSLLTMSYLGANGVVPHYGLMGPVKAALESLVRYMALELGGKGIRVHAVSPGPILTRAASGIESFDELMQHNIAKSPLGRLVRLEEIAHLSTFLCTDASSGMTGQTIYVDAGCHAVA